eukprot:CAMPEP_0170179542 /NCGR_PEP_ID=MMETSP0040_2-20121228/18243_1 /TAXON_ID=641309 /ORGANISM="Lotharella oceanica, Strain CCMP622" /LENGTH=63 /DNA_ID=CAMNT_0010423715 /DNA_START=226 /DNA_END=417 /DNA_ORIENTATION=-
MSAIVIAGIVLMSLACLNYRMRSRAAERRRVEFEQTSHPARMETETEVVENEGEMAGDDAQDP